jgi:alginate export protein
MFLMVAFSTAAFAQETDAPAAEEAATEAPAAEEAAPAEEAATEEAAPEEAAAPVEEAAPAPAEEAPVTQYVKIGKNTLSLTIGGSVRIRGIHTDNVSDFNDDVIAPRKGSSDYVDGDTWRSDRRNTGAYDSVNIFRERIRLWVAAKSEFGIGGKVRLVAEPRWGETDLSYMKDNNILFDNAYIEANNILGSPVSIRYGRQDLMCPGYCPDVPFWGRAPFYGEGFLVVDGSPWDGSRTIGFDAIKLNVRLDDYKTNIDLWAAKINEGVYSVDEDEDFYGFYVMNRSVAEAGLDFYVLHKNQNQDQNVTGIDRFVYNSGISGSADPETGEFKGKTVYAHVPSAVQTNLILQPRQNTTAIGFMLRGAALDGMISYATQFAYQLGYWDENATLFPTYTTDIARDAYGGYLWAALKLKDLPLAPKLSLGYVTLSGDKIDEDAVNTGDSYEQFDDMYGRWPKYSELMIYSNLDILSASRTVTADGEIVWQDTDEGVWSNMNIILTELGLYPIQGLELLVRYYMFGANETKFLYYDLAAVGGPAWQVGERKGNKRGDSLQLVANWSATPSLSVQGYYEMFMPGDYYQDVGSDFGADTATFARLQLNYKF